ncbi:helix-turn-helix transcriptional regulator [Sorangium sp. So ce429]
MQFKMDRQSFVDHLRARMAAEGLTQRALAGRLRVSQGQISRVLNGKFQRKSRVIRALEVFLGMPPASATTRTVEAEEMELLEAAREAADGSVDAMHLLTQLMHVVATLRAVPRNDASRKFRP